MGVGRGGGAMVTRSAPPKAKLRPLLIKPSFFICYIKKRVSTWRVLAEKVNFAKNMCLCIFLLKIIRSITDNLFLIYILHLIM